MSLADLKRCILVVVIIGCGACELVHVESETDEYVEKTYPGAFDLPAVDLSTALTSSEVADSLNVDVNVVGMHICPDHAQCIVPDRITIADRGDSDSELDSLFLTVTQPDQFEINRSYIMSLKVLNRIENE